MDEIDKKIVLIELKIDGWGISKDEQKWLVNRLKDYKEENKRLNGLFNLQSTRMDKAIKLWRESTGKHDTIPDLGDLLEWLMGIIKQETGTLTPILNRYLSKREIEQRTKDACKKAARNYLVDKELENCDSWNYEDLEKAIQETVIDETRVE